MSQMGTHVDLEMLSELKDIMEDDFNILIETYLQDSNTRITDITEAYNDRDSEALRGAAHSFKGSSSNVGAVLLADLCKTAEDLGREGRVEEVQDLLEKIDEEYQSVREIMTTQMIH